MLLHFYDGSDSQYVLEHPLNGKTIDFVFQDNEKVFVGYNHKNIKTESAIDVFDLNTKSHLHTYKNYLNKGNFLCFQ